MRLWSDLFLVRLYRHNKILFLAVFVFFIVNIVFNTVKPTQQTPIYNWNLYAYPLPVLDTFTFITVQYNEGKILRFKRTWNEPKKVLLNNTLNLYISNQIDGNLDYSQEHFANNWLPQHPHFSSLFPSFTNFPTKKDFKHFPIWYKNYLGQHTNQSIDSIKFFRKVVLFNNEGDIKEIFSKQIFSIR